MTKGSEYLDIPVGEEHPDEDLDYELLGPLTPEGLEPKAFTVVDVARRIAAIRSIQRKMEVLKQARQTMQTFYKTKEERYEQSIEEILGQCRAYLEYAGLKNLPTPQGTVYMKKVTEYEYDDIAIKTWLDGLTPEERAHFVRIKEEIDKMALRGLPEAPPGLTKTEKEKVYVR